MAYNKIVYNNKTLIDLTNDTVTPATLDKGVTAHSKTGEIITGTRIDEIYIGVSEPTDKHKVWIKPI